jgi:hypothetical protein
MPSGCATIRSREAGLIGSEARLAIAFGSDRVYVAGRAAAHDGNSGLAILRLGHELLRGGG